MQGGNEQSTRFKRESCTIQRTALLCQLAGRPPQSVYKAVAPCKIETHRKKELQCAVIIAILIVK